MDLRLVEIRGDLDVLFDLPVRLIEDDDIEMITRKPLVVALARLCLQRCHRVLAVVSARSVAFWRWNFAGDLADAAQWLFGLFVGVGDEDAPSAGGDGLLHHGGGDAAVLPAAGRKIRDHAPVFIPRFEDRGERVALVLVVLEDVAYVE